MSGERTDVPEAEGLRHNHLVTVTVNEKPVKLLGPRETGQGIKIAAIEQGVEIGKDYLLDEVLRDGANRRIEDHERIELHEHMMFAAHQPVVVVRVNEQQVKLNGHSATGAEIKMAAIAQGVAIQPNFVLQEELPNGTSRIVGDRDRVHLREHLRFTAIAPDDNS
jgi:hypothetical protein